MHSPKDLDRVIIIALHLGLIFCVKSVRACGPIFVVNPFYYIISYRNCETIQKNKSHVPTVSRFPPSPKCTGWSLLLFCSHWGWGSIDLRKLTVPDKFVGTILIKRVEYDDSRGFKVVVGKPEDGRKLEKFCGKIAFRTGDNVQVEATAKSNPKYALLRSLKFIVGDLELFMRCKTCIGPLIPIQMTLSRVCASLIEINNRPKKYCPGPPS